MAAKFCKQNMASASSDVGSDVGHSAPALRIPAFPPEILLPNWRNNRADSSKLNTAAYSIRCTLASMCGMHVHRTGDKRKQDIWACCEEVYGRLLRQAFAIHCSPAEKPPAHPPQVSQPFPDLQILRNGRHRRSEAGRRGWNDGHIY